MSQDNRKGAAKLGYNERGEEIPDPTKPELPLGFKKPESLAQQVARLVKSEQMRQAAKQMGRESFEEADDFDVGDDYDPRSPYEEVFDPTANEAPEVIEEVQERVKKRKAKAKDEQPAPKKTKAPEPKAKGSGESEGDAPSEE